MREFSDYMRQPLPIKAVQKEMSDNKVVGLLLRCPLQKISVMKFHAR